MLSSLSLSMLAITNAMLRPPAVTITPLSTRFSGDAHVLDVSEGEYQGRYVVFYGDDQYGGEPVFSNQYPSAFIAQSVVDRDVKKYFCVEQYMMAEKARLYSMENPENALVAERIMSIIPDDRETWRWADESLISDDDFAEADEDPSAAMATKLLGSEVDIFANGAQQRWFDLQQAVLEAGISAKFEQNPQFSETLAATQGMVIAEGPDKNYGLGVQYEDWLDAVRAEPLKYAHLATDAPTEGARNILGRAIMNVRDRRAMEKASIYVR